MSFPLNKRKSKTRLPIPVLGLKRIGFRMENGRRVRVKGGKHNGKEGIITDVTEQSVNVTLDNGTKYRYLKRWKGVQLGHTRQDLIVSIRHNDATSVLDILHLLDILYSGCV